MASHPKTASIEPKQRRSDHLWTDTCPDCGTTIIAATPDDVLSAVCACQGRRIVRHLVELVCAHCSRYITTVVLIQPRAPVLVPRQLRCLSCGGQPIPGEYSTETTYSPMPRVVPRRSRPSKWLQELRRSA